jgi:hypothetical protein
LIVLNCITIKKIKVIEKHVSDAGLVKLNNKSEINRCIQTTQRVVNTSTRVSNLNELFKCRNYYDNKKLNETIRYKYDSESDKQLREMEIVRGILIYFPIKQFQSFHDELKWLYRSWIEMQKYESDYWRTDLVISMDVNMAINLNKMIRFEDLNCTINNLRKSKKDKPMCTILNYVSIGDRILNNTNSELLNSMSSMEVYSHLFKNIDVFNKNNEYFWMFLAKLKDLKHFSYIDSILMAFDGYNYFLDQFDFLLRSDIDVFLTPLFAKWLPLNCYDFIVGGGAYTHDFNIRRLQKAANIIGLKPGSIRNLGIETYIAYYI